MGHSPHILMECLMGQIGDGMAGQFLAWVKVEDRMPTVEQVITQPLNAPIFGNRDADILHMLLTNLVEVSTPKNLDAVTTYLKRMQDKEWLAVWAKDVQLRHPEVNDTKIMRDFKLSEITKIIA